MTEPTTPQPVAAPPSPAPVAGVQPAADATPEAPAKVEVEVVVPESAPAPESILGDVEDKPEAEQDAADKVKAEQSPGEALDVTIPEGLQYDAAALEDYKALAAKEGLTSEQASNIAAWQLQRQQEATTAQLAVWRDQGEVWGKELRADAEFGGDKYDATVAYAKKALRFAGGEDKGKSVAAELRELGIDNLPSLVKVFARFGQALDDDNTGVGGAGGKAGSGELSRRAQLKRDYPGMPEEHYPDD